MSHALAVLPEVEELDELAPPELDDVDPPEVEPPDVELPGEEPLEEEPPDVEPPGDGSSSLLQPAVSDATDKSPERSSMGIEVRGMGRA